MSDNQTIFQFFHWNYPNDGSLWKHCAKESGFLEKLGFTYVWLPPAYKSAWGMNEPGYAVYDHFDLGEFDQHGTVPTKYGTKKDYLNCIKALHQHNVKILADIVLNHKVGGDETEKFKVKEVNPDNRTEIAAEVREIDAFTKFTFPGRRRKYSDFVWDWRSFSGVSKEENGENKIYTILNEYGEGWEEMMDDENGNFDYLMGNDIEYRNQYVREELKKWGKWYIETTGIDGFRFDAVKHINHQYIKEWLEFQKSTFKKDFFCIAEYWNFHPDILISWINAMDNQVHLVDVPLHHNFYQASLHKVDYDMTKIFDDTLIQHHPQRTITFIDNHDTQPLQSLESFVEFWFKPLANAMVLLREQGIPCIFYPCLYGATYDGKRGEEDVHIELAPVPGLREMLLVRKHLAFGEQHDYLDHANVIGWTRSGVPEKENSGYAVLLSNGAEGFKKMNMGKEFANTVFIDITGNRQETSTTDENGEAEFRVNEGSVSVWIKLAAKDLIAF